jgi:coenzyme F420-reducing hydrogenase alpha subunit
LSENVSGFICNVCGSHNVTLDAARGVVICNICGYQYAISPLDLVLLETISSSSTSPVAGTSAQEPLVKKEEVVGFRRVTQEVLPHTHEELREHERRIAELKDRIDALSTKFDELRGALPKVVVLEEISKEDAKDRIEEYFKEHKTADIEELMLNLKIPVQSIVEALDELKREGKVTAEDEDKT